MANLRKIPTSKLKTFGDLINKLLDMNLHNYEYGDLYYIFDKYEEPSTKDTERVRRAGDLNAAIEYSSISLSTKLPNDMDRFWPSVKNKILLEDLVYESTVTRAKAIQTVNSNKIILDETVNKPTVFLINKSVVTPSHWRTSPFEEADLRLPYVVWKALRDGTKIFLILSNDTDIHVAFLNHMTLLLKF